MSFSFLRWYSFDSLKLLALSFSTIWKIHTILLFLSLQTATILTTSTTGCCFTFSCINIYIFENKKNKIVSARFSRFFLLLFVVPSAEKIVPDFQDSRVLCVKLHILCEMWSELFEKIIIMLIWWSVNLLVGKKKYKKK